jgi:hypothetical protein
VGSLAIAWRKLQAWPANRPPTDSFDRQSSGQFKTPVIQTLSDLEGELEKIDARDVVIEIDVDHRELRMMGEPRPDAKTLMTPGLVLRFTDSRGRTAVMPCDRYDTWQANARALYLTLKSLRAVDRYGATAGGEQYGGWLALPATTTAFTVDQAISFLARLSGISANEIREQPERARAALRVATNVTHPDKAGSTGNFQLTQEAKRVLEAHFGQPL